MNARQNGWKIMAYSRARRTALDLNAARRRHMIHGLIEVDVTRARALLREGGERTDEALAFSAFIVSCLARAVDEDRFVQAYRLGRRRLIIFDDVDVRVIIERAAGGATGTVSHVVRAANGKTFRQIRDELRAMRQETARRVAGPRWLWLYVVAPDFARRRFIRAIAKRPRLWKRVYGTIAVTSTGMSGQQSAWGIPLSAMPLDLTIGGICTKPGVVDGQTVVRDYLDLTISFDHDVIDGGPAARFSMRLKDLIESAYGLAESRPQPEPHPLTP